MSHATPSNPSHSSHSPSASPVAASGSGAGPSRYEQFQSFRSRLNERILGQGTSDKPSGTLQTKRFFTLDGNCYQPGALDGKTKELLGLAASMVLRCDDCIAYHIDQCIKVGCTDQELWECFDIALIVGGSIVIPHLRRGVEFMDEARARMPQGGGAAH